MQTDLSNTWLTGAKQVDFYVSSADVIIVERQRMIALLLDLFRYHFEPAQGLHVLDLGCGDGVITERVRELYPDNAFYLLDGSPDMLEKARQKLGDDRVTFIHQSFEEYLDSPVDDQKYDFIFSANAIHHLDWLGKSRMYARLFRELKYGGLFIDIDPVLPTSERSERWQLRMWADWMNEMLHKHKLGDVGQYDDVPSACRAKAENKLSTLFDQMQLLGQIGFRDVDCFYKYGLFAVFGGTK
ncbi:MAG: class I SAM-dependent methyltransferase [Thermoflexales bacterium]|nr:class I SAM-dependent methyltransferase [Thermoflexales bacterium]